MKTKLLSLVFALVASVGTIFAEKVQIGDLYYNLDTENLTAEVTYQEYWTINNYSGLTSVNISSSVTYNSQTYSVTRIGESAFLFCMDLTSITIPNSVTSIGGSAFYNCRSLTSMTMLCETPPALGPGVFYREGGSYFDGVIYVPCGSKEAYKSAENWSSYESLISYAPSPYTLTTKAENGYVSYQSDLTICDKTVELTAEPYYGYYFVHWADGNTDNPRTIELTQDTIMEAVFAYVTYVYDGSMGWVGGSAGSNNSITITAEPSRGCYFVKWEDGNIDNPRIIEMTQDTTMEAIFGYLPIGKCGKDEALTWMFDAKTKVLEITGKGELTDNFTYTYNLESVTIGNEITIIGEDAFYNCYQIKNIIIGSSVKVIEHNAYSSCYEFASITCYCQRPPTVKEGAFYYNLPYSTIIYVPADYLATYKAHDFWGMYDVRPLGAATVETNDVKVTPTETTAAVVWPAVSGAATYELVIKDKNGNIICTLIFNANGQLTQIAFGAPARDKSTQATGFSFIVTGLEAGTSYDLTITSKDDQGNVLQTQTQSFTTAGAASGIHQTNATAAPQKVLRDGKVLILRDGKTYTVQGQEVR